jgi:hypothetical protein
VTTLRDKARAGDNFLVWSGEWGLLGLALHPHFESNGFFCVDYTDEIDRKPPLRGPGRVRNRDGAASRGLNA